MVQVTYSPRDDEDIILSKRLDQAGARVDSTGDEDEGEGVEGRRDAQDTW